MDRALGLTSIVIGAGLSLSGLQVPLLGYGLLAFGALLLILSFVRRASEDQPVDTDDERQAAGPISREVYKVGGTALWVSLRR